MIARSSLLSSTKLENEKNILKTNSCQSLTPMTKRSGSGNETLMVYIINFMWFPFIIPTNLKKVGAYWFRLVRPCMRPFKNVRVLKFYVVDSSSNI